MKSIVALLFAIVCTSTFAVTPDPHWYWKTSPFRGQPTVEFVDALPCADQYACEDRATGLISIKAGLSRELNSCLQTRSLKVLDGWNHKPDSGDLIGCDVGVAYSAAAAKRQTITYDTPRESLLPQPFSLRACAAADVMTTIYGIRSAKMIEVASPLKASINAGHFAPFVLATIGVVALIEWLDKPAVTDIASVVECGFALNNLAIFFR